MSTLLPVPGGVTGPAGGQPGATPVRYLPLPAGWPLTALLVLYPLWWLLGLGTLIVFILAVPMAVHLLRRRPIAVPPGFGLWLLFLGWVVLSATMLGQNPAGTLPGSAGGRSISFLFNLAGYVAVAVVLLYVGSLSEREYPRARLVRHLGWLFIVVVAGGLLGTFAPTFEFTAPVELLLPRSVAQNDFVQSWVHPAAAQLQQVLGYTSGRPSAPFGYTNMWGNVLSLLLGFFVVSWFTGPRQRPRLLGVLVLLAAAIPVVYSLNRGLWIGLALTVLFVALRLALRGRLLAIGVLIVGLVVASAVLLLSPLTGIIEGRLDNPKSDGIRAFTAEVTWDVVDQSPVVGFGSTRPALGSSNSIAIGRTADCPSCGNPTVGSNGQFWLLLVAQGYVGTALYLAYFLRTMWAYRRDDSATGAAAMLACGLPFLYMFLYNALVVPLLITFLAIGLLWRNDRDDRTCGGDEAPVDVGGLLRKPPVHRRSVPVLPPRGTGR